MSCYAHNLLILRKLSLQGYVNVKINRILPYQDDRNQMLKEKIKRIVGTFQPKAQVKKCSLKMDSNKINLDLTINLEVTTQIRKIPMTSEKLTKVITFTTCPMKITPTPSSPSKNRTDEAPQRMNTTMELPKSWIQAN